jgi:predicted amidohydrolase
MSKNERLTVTLIQGDLQVKTGEDNLGHFTNLMEEVETDSGLVILPELFTYGFVSNIRDLAEEMNGKTVKWMQTQAEKSNLTVMGSAAIKENGNFFNRFLAVHPEGKIEHYDKRHLFRMLGEHKILDSGKKRVILNYSGWKISPMVCYDLRFPVWSRKRNRDEYDLLIYTANWPQARSYHWRALLAARAIENQSYVIGVNRCGMDSDGALFRGDSMVIDPYGKIISDLGEGEKTATLTLDKSAIHKSREEFPTWMDADDFIINV